VKNWHSLTLCLLLLFVPPFLFAQVENATITGRITDPVKAVVVGAQVSLINVGTNVRYEGITNGTGSYVVSAIPPGTYRAEVGKPGFKTIVATGIVLHVQDTIELNFEMALGSVSESVTVTEGGISMNTKDASVGTVIDRKFVENTPLNGRSFQDLISLTPGVVTQTPQLATDTGIGISGDFSVNGQRTASNYYTVDGVSANISAGNGNGGPTAATSGSIPTSTVLGTTQSLVSVDALQEFRVESSTYSAEFGRSPGGQFTFVTRSGTNQFHGSGFEYLRNGFFDANDWFNNYYQKPQPALRQNDFGGTLGGPVWFPGLYNGRDKTFFFISYEGLRLTQPQAASVQYVPDTYMREQASPALQPILNAFPIQNGKDYGTPASPSLAEFIKGYSSPSDIDATSIRFDHAFSSRLTLFFRYGETPSSTLTRYLSSATAQNMGTHTYTGGVTGLISANLTNQFRLGYADSSIYDVTNLDTFGGAVPLNLANAVGLNANRLPQPVFDIYIPGTGNTNLSTAASNTSGRNWNVVDVAEYSFGKHQLKFGLDYRRISAPLNPSSLYGEALYQSAQSLKTNSADILVVYKSLPANPVFNQTALFAQDAWRVSTRVNLSLGIRWEIDPAPKDGNGSDPYIAQGDPSAPSTLAIAPRGTPLWKTSWYNFAPRVGVAWKAQDKPTWETVFRAGGGVFFDSNNQAAASAFGGLGFTGSGYYFGSPLPITSSQINNVSTAVSPPYTNAIVFAFPRHLQLPYTLEWNVSAQQALGKSQALTISYVGANGRRLQGAQSLNITSANPNFGAIEYFDSHITSSYNALQMQFQRSVTRGLGVLASYTWSHSLDFGSNYSALKLTRGNSDFDLRNSFSGAVTWELPRISTSKFSGFLLNNWGVDGRLTARTGFPITLEGNYLTDPSTGRQYFGNVDVVPNTPVYLYGPQYPGGRAVNLAAFSLPPAGQDGNAPRNFVRGFGMWQINMAVRREFPIYERLHLQFRAEAFNILNHPNFGYVDAGLTDANFGLATRMLNQSLGTVAAQYQQGGARSLQFALKLLF
jgi:hypothetical protein